MGKLWFSYYKFGYGVLCYRFSDVTAGDFEVIETNMSGVEIEAVAKILNERNISWLNLLGYFHIEAAKDPTLGMLSEFLPKVLTADNDLWLEWALLS